MSQRSTSVAMGLVPAVRSTSQYSLKVPSVPTGRPFIEVMMSPGRMVAPQVEESQVGRAGEEPGCGDP